MTSPRQERVGMLTFMAANFAAGVLHYLFQVLAVKRLDSAAFSSLSSWMAYLSFGFVIAGLVQYSANFLPLSKHGIRIGSIGALLVTILTCIVLLAQNDASNAQLSVFAILLAIITSWLSGQAQSRMMFITLAVANVLLALTKISFPFSSVIQASIDRQFFYAIGFGYVPAILILGVRFVLASDEAKQVERFPVPKALAGTLLLAFGATILPQFELILMEKTQTVLDFQAFARVSLFYKAVFFGFLIFAQWLLPHQLHRGRRVAGLHDWRLFLASLAASTVAAFTAYYFVASPLWVFLSCLNTCLLTWIFVLIQEYCAKQELRRAIILLSGAALGVVFQMVFKFSVEIYYTVAIAANALIIVRSVRQNQTR